VKVQKIIGLFLFSRLILLISLPLEGLRGFGDLVHFYQLARMGWPFIDFWVEFPPVFPFISHVVYLLAGGKEHIYDYLLVIMMTIAQAVSLWVFIRLAEKIQPANEASQNAWIYFALALCLPYGWWYFDSLAVLAMLLGVLRVFEGKEAKAGIAIALGTLTKFFPALVLPMVWRGPSSKRRWIVLFIALGITLAVYGGLYTASPAQTLASMRSQGAKGSWETMWALVDGNFNTGNFGPESERYDPSTAQQLRGYPAKLPSWLTLIPFATLGGWLFWRVRLKSTRAAVAFLGVTWCLFLLWSPGYSPQWVLYLIPLILLALPMRQAWLFAIILTLVNVLEWPVMLSRGYNWGLWLTISLRTIIWILLAVEFWREANKSGQMRERTEADWIIPDPT
jgi:hypothetical protein